MKTKKDSMQQFFLAIISGVLIICVSAFASAEDCKSIPSSLVLVDPGEYCLRDDLDLTESNGLVISESNISVDLGGHVISAKSSDLVSAITIEGRAKRVSIRNGTIHGAKIGINIYEADQVHVSSLQLQNIGAIGINSFASDVRINNNVFEGVGFNPLSTDNAYSIAINVAGANVYVTENVILDAKRQNLSAEVVGEAVGVLVGSDCKECFVEHNEILKKQADSNSYGVWNAGLGAVEISGNSISGYANGITSAGRQYTVLDNKIDCRVSGNGIGVGVALTLRHDQDADSYGGAANNDVSNCSLDILSCFSNACRKQLARELRNRAKL
ncbi:hypothetical protein [Thalassospira australica]|uniref:hypothetical protein n=1 Tax=Thalassospira australica TaxID=1528106 RepID=UPI0012E09E1A|nr:hypothetical protein [Thalassospira australica]